MKWKVVALKYQMRVVTENLWFENENWADICKALASYTICAGLNFIFVQVTEQFWV